MEKYPPESRGKSIQRKISMEESVDPGPFVVKGIWSSRRGEAAKPVLTMPGIDKIIVITSCASVKRGIEGPAEFQLNNQVLLAFRQSRAHGTFLIREVKMPHRLQGLPLHILVAEDSPDEAYLFELLFAQCQVLSTYEIVSSGQEAIDYLSGKPPFNDRGEHPSPTLFLLDIKMPGLDGFDVLHWMQQHPEKAVIPTYILTCSGASTDVRQAFALGAYGYFIKQSGIQQYTELLTTVSRFWQMGQWPVPLERAGSIGEAARAGGPTVHN